MVKCSLTKYTTQNISLTLDIKLITWSNTAKYSEDKSRQHWPAPPHRACLVCSWTSSCRHQRGSDEWSTVDITNKLKSSWLYTSVRGKKEVVLCEREFVPGLVLSGTVASSSASETDLWCWPEGRWINDTLAWIRYKGVFVKSLFVCSFQSRFHKMLRFRKCCLLTTHVKKKCD